MKVKLINNKDFKNEFFNDFQRLINQNINIIVIKSVEEKTLSFQNRQEDKSIEVPKKVIKNNFCDFNEMKYFMKHFA